MRAAGAESAGTASPETCAPPAPSQQARQALRHARRRRRVSSSVAASAARAGAPTGRWRPAPGSAWCWCTSWCTVGQGPPGREAPPTALQCVGDPLWPAWRCRHLPQVTAAWRAGCCRLPAGLLPGSVAWALSWIPCYSAQARSNRSQGARRRYARGQDVGGTPGDKTWAVRQETDAGGTPGDRRGRNTKGQARRSGRQAHGDVRPGGGLAAP